MSIRLCRVLVYVVSRSGIHEDHTASYFSHDNAHATHLRDSLAEDSLESLISWLKEGGNVGIHGTRFYLVDNKN